MDRSYITEAFKKFDLLESEEFSIDASGLGDLESFLDKAAVDPDEENVEIYDLEAEAKEELKQSYIGKIIAKCNVCQSDVFIAPEDVTVDENDEPFIDMECPYCMTQGDFLIVGEVAPLGSEKPAEVTSEEDDIEIADIENPESGEDDIDEALESDCHNRFCGKKAVEESSDCDEGLGGALVGGALGAAAGHPIIGAIAGSKIQNKIKNQNESIDCEESDDCDEGLGKVAAKAASAVAGTKAAKSVGKALKVGAGAALDSIKDDIVNESIEGATIETEDETMTMSTNDEGGVVIETIPKDGLDEVEGEVIAPISDEAVADIDNELTNDEEEQGSIEDGKDDFEVEDFDEESFDHLGEAYLKRCYENVNSFKTSNVSIQDNNLIVEGLISFSSGNTKPTSFIFKKVAGNKNSLKLEGYNKNISKGKKAFKLNCNIQDNKLVCESLNYNYKSKNDLNESVRVYGTVRKVK